MKRVSTLELLRHFGVLSDTALLEPIILTKSGRDRLVLLSIEQYDTLRQAYNASQGNRSPKVTAIHTNRRRA